MASKEINRNPIIANPKSWLSWDFIITFSGREISELDLVSFSKEGSFTVNHYKYKVSREGIFTGDFLLESYNKIVAKAKKPSAFRRRFIIKALDQEFELCRESIGIFYDRSIRRFNPSTMNAETLKNFRGSGKTLRRSSAGEPVCSNCF